MSDADRAGAYYQAQAQGHHGALVKAHERIRALEAALEIAQGEAYLGTLAGKHTPGPLAACENVIGVCLDALAASRAAG